jgi:hypothetical protein
MALGLGRLQTGYVVYEFLRDGELTPAYYPITILPDAGETYAAMLNATLPEAVTYRGVFERCDDAAAWVENWRRA